MSDQILIGWQRGIPDAGIVWPAGYKVIEIGNSIGELVQNANWKKLNFLIIRASFEGYPEQDWAEMKALKGIGLISTGQDNLPVHIFRELQFAFISAEGCNANAVADYVSLAFCEYVQNHGGILQAGFGLVGCGNTGGRIYRRFKAAGLEKICFYDPYVEGSASLGEVLSMPVVSFHVPLTYSGGHATVGMLNANYFKDSSPMLIQTSRGKLWDPEYYSDSAKAQQIFCQDVYPQEPPNSKMVQSSYLSTPHIAGYSTIGRLGGIFKAVKKFFPEIKLPALPNSEVWNLFEESNRLKDNTDSFLQRRNTFPWRKELHEYNKDELATLLKQYDKLPETFIRKLVA
ncbi:MAG: hypothetical protein KDK38_05225 [Leptospiraceae bacterium]|nr:hypothetical protein [Leptospiraceae bacterium]